MIERGRERKRKMKRGRERERKLMSSFGDEKRHFLSDYDTNYI